LPAGIIVPAFPQRSPPRYLTAAACGGLRSAPDCRTQRALLHLSYSCAPPVLMAVLVSHDPEQTTPLLDRDWSHRLGFKESVPHVDWKKEELIVHPLLLGFGQRIDNGTACEFQLRRGRHRQRERSSGDADVACGLVVLHQPAVAIYQIG
jgi:hypothetical protein